MPADFFSNTPFKDPASREETITLSDELTDEEIAQFKKEAETQVRRRVWEVDRAIREDGAVIGAGAFKTDSKDTKGKPSVWRGVMNYFPRALLEVAKVSDFGHSKYGEWGGWAKVDNAKELYSDAKCRHMLYEAMGRPVDDESDLLDAAHEAWNALARLELLCREKEDDKRQDNSEV